MQTLQNAVRRNGLPAVVSLLLGLSSGVVFLIAIAPGPNDHLYGIRAVFGVVMVAGFIGGVALRKL